MSKHFTLAQAQSLIPRVDRLLREAIALKSGFIEAERAFQSFNERITLMGGMTIDRDRFLQAKIRRDSEAERLRKACPRIQTYLGDCQTRLDFPDGYFDRVLAVHVLEHLPNLPAAIREMYRLCNKATGLFSVVIPCEGSLAYSLAREISAKRIFQKRYHRPYHLFISREHINLPWEVLGEIAPFFQMVHSAYFPIPLKFEFCNLFIGASFKPKTQPDP